ncbi:MAG: hypothetical protein IPP07_25135 [Holophagales bacterium]|nr:hypothetical protein [Holophagales bacterium]
MTAADLAPACISFPLPGREGEAVSTGLLRSIELASAIAPRGVSIRHFPGLRSDVQSSAHSGGVAVPDGDENVIEVAAVVHHRVADSRARASVSGSTG